jgi:hypothetical protein
VTGATVVIATANLASVTVSCPAGKVAVGGGGKPGGNQGIVASFPAGSPTPTGWTALFGQANTGNTAYVICAN